MKKRSEKRENKRIQINLIFTNRFLYTLIAVAIMSTIAVGVYAWGTTTPSTFGHSAGEMDFSGGVSGNARFNGNVGIGTAPTTSRLTIGSGSLRLPTSASMEGAGQIQCTDTVKFANVGNAQGIYAKQVSISDSWADNDANTQTNGLYVKGPIYSATGRKTAGTMQLDNPTQNAVFDALSPSIAVGSSLIISGGFRYSGYSCAISHATRPISTRIDLYGICDGGWILISMTDGSSTISLNNAYMAW